MRSDELQQQAAAHADQLCHESPRFGQARSRCQGLYHQKPSVHVSADENRQLFPVSARDRGGVEWTAAIESRELRVAAQIDDGDISRQRPRISARRSVLEQSAADTHRLLAEQNQNHRQKLFLQSASPEVRYVRQQRMLRRRRHSFI